MPSFGRRHIPVLDSRAQRGLCSSAFPTRGRLDDFQDLPLLEVAWQLKEELRRWYATATTAQQLDEWMKKVRAYGSDHLGNEFDSPDELAPHRVA